MIGKVSCCGSWDSFFEEDLLYVGEDLREKPMYTVHRIAFFYYQEKDRRSRQRKTNWVYMVHNKEKNMNEAEPECLAERRPGRAGSSDPGYAERINRVLFAIADAVNTTEDLDELYRTIRHILSSILDVTNFFIALVDSGKRTLHFPYFIDTVDEIFSPIDDFHTGSSLTGLLVEERKPLLLHRDVLEKRASEGGILGSAPLIWMGSPLLIRDEVIGALGLQSYTDPDLYDEADLQILTAISHQIAVAIDRKRFLDKLKKSEEQYRQLVENVNSIILRMDSRGRILFFNEFAQGFFGYAAEEIVGKNLVGTIVPAIDSAGKDLQTLIADIGRLPELHRTSENESICRDGTRAWISWTNSPFYNTAGELVDILCVGNDITNRKEMEQTLREKSEELERYFTLSLDLLCIADTSGRFLKVNPQWPKILGYSEAELVGKSFLDLVHPDDVDKTLAAMARLEGRQDVLNFQNRYRCSDGSYRWIEWASRSPQGDRIYAVARDISKRKQAEKVLMQSEETFRNIVQAAPMGIHIYQLQSDDKLILIGTNPAADTLLRVDNKQFIGKTLEEAFPPLQETEIPMRYRKAAQFGESWQTEQIEYSHGHITGAFEVHVFQMSQGKAVVLFNEITRRKQAEEEREKLQVQLTQAQKMESVGRLAGGVAHDFNNMLGVILGHTELALSKLDPSQPVFSSLVEINKAAKRSADLTRQLLAFARKQTIAPKVLDLNHAVNGTLTMLRRLIGEDIDLVWLPAENLGSVNIDPTQIDQILANLCVNAADAISDTGKITIETDGAVLDEDYCMVHAGYVPGEYVLLTVSDDGCGMDKETMVNLFEPFFTTKELGKGTGLGLATVYGIVKQNKGFINVYSEPGHGTTVKVYLPQYQAEVAQKVMRVGKIAEARGNETILLVEDEPMILDITKAMLELQGYKVLPAITPGEAIRLAREHAGEIHMVMTDVVMPEMNGRDLAKNLLALYPNMKRLFMSGYTANVIAHHGVLDAGVHFIQKPFSIDDLAAKVREALG
jgi:two-component system, cell cycle sensor histidine kinase and response regulator CckA